MAAGGAGDSGRGVHPRVIKRIHFASRTAEQSADRFRADRRRWAEGRASAPAGIRPFRITVSFGLPEVLTVQPYDAVGMEWFEDSAHLDEFESWRSGPEGAGSQLLATEATGPTVVAEEVVGRGADWLEQRWARGGISFKHLALARRATDLTPSQFSERWRAHGGSIGMRGGGRAAIPFEARGAAYVQNHPLTRVAGEWAYDAVNEVWFDDVDGLRRRVEWFAANLGAGAGSDLFGASWFLAVAEEIV